MSNEKDPIQKAADGLEWFIWKVIGWVAGFLAACLYLWIGIYLCICFSVFWKDDATFGMLLIFFLFLCWILGILRWLSGK